jgi:hypothetical protein
VKNKKMTNREAIEELNARYLTISQCLDKEELNRANTAISMAIKALEQEPTALKQLKDEILVKGFNSPLMNPVFTAFEILKMIDEYMYGDGKKLKDQEPCEDAVSRQTVKEQMIKYGFHAPDMTVTEFVEDLPSVNLQEPKTGQWIKVTNGRGGHECDLCHEYAPSYQSGDEYLTNYCPNCGARMVEPQESEENDE